MRMAAAKWVWVAAIAACVIAAFPARGFAQDAGGAKTLSLRTDDGLVVADCSMEKAEELMEKMAAMDNPPSAGRDVYRWLLSNNIPADSIRIYLGKTAAGGADSKKTGMKWTVSGLREAERRGEIPAISGLELFEAYMILRSAGYEVFLSEKDIKKTQTAMGLKHTIFALSFAFQNGYHGIYVDGKDYSRAETGYNIVTIPSGGEVVDKSVGYSLYVDVDAGRKMADFLNGLPKDTIVLASINHGPGVFLTSAAVSALQQCGSAESPDPEVLSSHAMIGKKGMAPGTAIEKSTVNAGSNVIYFSDDLYVDVSDLEKVFPGGSGRAIILTGTGADDKTYVYSD